MPTPEDDLYTRSGALRLDRPVEELEIYDLVICGGGPCGTTAAMRAKELGLTALVIDYDDLMKRIRDYPKEKLILPSYGGADKTPFPPGGELVQDLYFEDIDKDDLVGRWKQAYRKAGIAARIGTEMTAIESGGDGVWTAVCWNHRAGREQRFRARNVLVAVGAGVPRRFDIPGDTDGIAFRLEDPATFVGTGPALVIGGGTSAAEAVIAISNAKAAAEDGEEVFWSYRAAKMPKVSKALGDVFFEAYVGNGNIRYLPYSDAAAVVVGEDRRDYLSLRVDRKLIQGRPAETVHYEFAKQNVIACIGTDLPVKLLQRLGIKVPLVNEQPRMLVTHAGETNLRGVFLAGDARGPRFLRCSDLDDSGTWEKISLKRNIKAAMSDAVEVVEVIARRLGVELPDQPPAAAELQPVRDATAPTPPTDRSTTGRVRPPTGTHPAEPSEGATIPILMTLHPDGTPEEEFPLRDTRVEIGRKDTAIECPEETYMADHHATLERTATGWRIVDTGAGSGVWLRVEGPDGTPLRDGDQLWLGSQMLVASRGPDGWYVTHYDPEGVERESTLVGSGLMIGRTSTLVLDPGDRLLSRRHAQLVPDGDGLRVYDRGARNGTYLFVRGSVELHSGEEFRLATKRFRLEDVAAVEKLQPSAVIREAPTEPERAAAASGSTAEPVDATPTAGLEPGAAAAAAVRFEHEEHPAEWTVPSGTTILQAYMDQGGAQDEPLGWECQKGVCGLCAIEIREGADNFAPVDESSNELKTIQIAVGVEPDPGRYRLACMSRIAGPVKVCVPE